MDDKQIKYSNKLPLKSAIFYIEELIAALRSGRVYVVKGEKSMELYPQAKVKCKVEAQHKKDEEKLKIKIRWLSRAYQKEYALRIGSVAGRVTTPSGMKSRAGSDDELPTPMSELTIAAIDACPETTQSAMVLEDTVTELAAEPESADEVLVPENEVEVIEPKKMVVKKKPSRKPNPKVGRGKNV